jgi:bifunctional non-homologous end joining protein LigD
MPTCRAVTLPLVTPIVPVLRDQPFGDPAYLFEPKYDGFRGLLYLSGWKCHFLSKRGNVLKQFEQLCYWAREELRVKEAILDGEVVALDPERSSGLPRAPRAPGKPSLRRLRRPLAQREGPARAATRRKRALERLIPATTTVLSRVFAVEGRGRDLFAAAERLDLEGIVAKRMADPYRPEAIWYKVKNRAYTPAKGRWGLFQKSQ